MRTARDNLNLLNDLFKMAKGATGSFGEIRQQLKGLVKERVDQLMTDMDMVSRREFERVEAVAIKARERQEQLEKRLAELEKKLKAKAPAAKKGKKK